MTRVNTVFTAAEGMSPEYAARLSDLAARYRAEVSIDCGGKVLRLDSLICILSMELYRGVKVSVIAEGEEAEEAAKAVVGLLEGA